MENYNMPRIGEDYCESSSNIETDEIAMPNPIIRDDLEPSIFNERMNYLSNYKPMKESKFCEDFSNDVVVKNVTREDVYSAFMSILEKVNIDDLYMDNNEDFICFLNSKSELELVMSVPQPNVYECSIPQGIVGVANFIKGVFSYNPYLEKVNNDTNTLTDASNLFRRYASNTLDLKDFNPTRITDMSCMFADAVCLKHLTLPDNFLHKDLVYAEDMFRDCHGLTNLVIGNGQYLEHLKSADGMFNSAYALETVTLNVTFNTKVLTCISDLFRDCVSLTHATVGSKIDTNVKGLPLIIRNTKSMLCGCPRIKYFNWFGLTIIDEPSSKSVLSSDMDLDNWGVPEFISYVYRTNNNTNMNLDKWGIPQYLDCVRNANNSSDIEDYI